MGMKHLFYFEKECKIDPILVHSSMNLFQKIDNVFSSNAEQKKTDNHLNTITFQNS